jgi:hypothetical protein
MFKINVFLILFLLTSFFIWLLTKEQEQAQTIPSLRPAVPENIEKESILETSQKPSPSTEIEDVPKSLPSESHPSTTISSIKNAQSTTATPFLSKELLLSYLEYQKDPFPYMKNFPKNDKRAIFLYKLSMSSTLYILLTAQEEMKSLDEKGKESIAETIFALDQGYSKIFDNYNSDILKDKDLRVSLKTLQDQALKTLKSKLTRELQRDLEERIHEEHEKVSDLILENPEMQRVLDDPRFKNKKYPR